MAKTIERSLNAGTSPAAASTVAVAACGGFGTYDTLTFVATITGATGGALDVYIQHSPDGVTWYDYVHFTQASAAAGAVTYACNPALTNSIVTIGAPTTPAATTPTPALAAGLCAGGAWFDQLRVVYVAGVSTSAGAAQVVKVLCTNSHA